MSAPTAASRRAWRLRYWHAAGLWALLLSPFLTWGLPTAGDDDLLFGGDEPWPPERYRQVRALQQRDERIGAADVDVDPLAPPEREARIIDLTATEDDRAAILLRYRLYTRQPDEMVVFMALAHMRPREGVLDPGLYQYGGGFIYAVAGAVAAAGAVGLLTLTSDLNHYLAHPDDFGRLYVAARCMPLVLGAIALVGVARLAERFGGRRGGWAALLLAALSPAVINGALEAKPHLASAGMMAWALAGALGLMRARPTPARLALLGAQVGYAFSLVLTGVIALLAPLLLGVVRPARWRRVAAVVAIALMVYAASNPYVVRHLLLERDALRTNVGNTAAMFPPGGPAAGAWRTGELLVTSLGPATPLVGLIGLLLAARRWPRRTLLVAGPAVVVALGWSLVAAGKPAEFARFLLLPALLLAVSAGAVVAALSRRSVPLAAGLFIACGWLTPVAPQVAVLLDDVSPERESRRTAGEYIAANVPLDAAIGLIQEPAPYATPPLDFTRRRVVLLPPASGAETAEELPPWLVLTHDTLSPPAGAWWLRHYALVRTFPEDGRRVSPISWASKPVQLYRLME